MTDFRQIVVFVRPWELPFLVPTARGLLEAGTGTAGGITYITLWKMAADWLEDHLLPGETVHFLCPSLANARPSAAQIGQFQAMERAWVQDGGTPFKTMLDAERFRPSGSAASLDFLWRHVAVLQPLIGEQALVLSQGVDHLCYWLAAELARHRGGRFVGFSCSGRPSGRTQVLKSATQLWLPRKAQATDRACVKDQREELLGGVKPDFMAPRKSRVGPWGSLKYRAKLIEEMRAGNYFVRPSDLIALSRGQDLLAQTRWQAAKRTMSPTPLDQVDGPFVYLPLHMEPEATTLVYSPTFNDQSFAIDVIAKSLPSGVSLLVKENPKMWGKRPLHFYERANRNAGLIWAEEDAATQAIVQRCDAVLTLTSTSALEAVLLDTPVACFGAPPFASALTSLPRVEALHALPGLVQGLLDRSLWPGQKKLLAEYATYVANLLPTPFYGTRMQEGIWMPAIPQHPSTVPFLLESLAP